jgi:hypothetical protein
LDEATDVRCAERGTRNAELGTLLGLGLGILAFLVHGLLDSFLAFTPTALLFWMLLGLTQPSAVSNQEHVPAESSKAARLRPLIRQ